MSKPKNNKSIIDYEYFLSRRFDLVTRYYILQESNFCRAETKITINDPKHANLRDIFSRLLRVSENKYEVARRLFLTQSWHWVDHKITENQNWINKNPYEIKIDIIIGGSVKRFLLPLLHEKPLPWIFVPKKKEFKLLWREGTYKKTLPTTEFNEIKKSQQTMMEKMEKLNFFSLNTYIGEEVLLEKYKKNL
jgi:hypothetical protein